MALPLLGGCLLHGAVARAEAISISATVQPVPDKAALQSMLDSCDFKLARMPLGRLDFAVGEASLNSATEQQFIASVAATLAGLQPSRLVVSGDADQRGPEVENAALAARRASTVLQVLRRSLPDTPMETVTRWTPNATPELLLASRARSVQVFAEFSSALAPTADRATSVKKLLVDGQQEAAAADLDFAENWRLATHSSAGGAVEFWLAASPAGDESPIIIVTDGTTRQAVYASADRKTISVRRQSAKPAEGEAPADEQVEFGFDFGDARPHHFVINDLASRIEVWVDGVLIGSVPSKIAFKETIRAGQVGPLQGLALGGFRFWSGSLDCVQIEALRDVDGEPSAAIVPLDSLVALSETSEGSLQYQLLPRVVEITSGPWVEYGTDAATKKTVGELDASNFAPIRDQEKRYRDDFYLKLSAQDDLFPAYPVFTIEQRFAAARNRTSRSRFVGSDRANAPRYDLLLPEAAELLAVELAYGATAAPGGFPVNYVQGLRLRYELAGATETSAWLGKGDGARLIKTFPDCQTNFAEGEEIIGMFGVADQGRVIDMRIVTSKGLSGPGCSSTGKPNIYYGWPQLGFSLWSPEQSGFAGFSATAKDEIDSLALAGRTDVAAATITVTREDGASETFIEIARNRYRSTRQVSILPQEDPVPYPVLSVLGENTITIDGVRRDFTSSLETTAPVGDKAFYDDTFVSNFKAVNLRANYGGYHLVKMDPLRLLDRGTDKLIFQQPSADSRAYYDFDRIFVPDGLKFIPEFHGGTSVETTTAKTGQEFKSHFSQTVGGSIGGGDAEEGAKFEASQTMKRGRERLEAQERSVAIGTARASLYSLVIDKSNMLLTNEFMQQVYRLRNATDEAYDRFIDSFGTHYAYGVEYGGLGVMQLALNREEQRIVAMSEDGFDVKFSATVDGASAGGNFSQNQSNESRIDIEKLSEVDDFYWIGGAHGGGGGRESWGVGEDGAVPIYVELRPIDELLAPPFFLDAEITNMVRPRLKARIDRLVGEVAAAAERDKNANLEHVFRIDFRRMFVVNSGDDIFPDLKLEVFGDIKMELTSGADLLGPSAPFFSRTPEAALTGVAFSSGPDDPAGRWTLAQSFPHETLVSLCQGPADNPILTSFGGLFAAAPLTGAAENSFQSVVVRTRELATAAIRFSADLREDDITSPDDVLTLVDRHGKAPGWLKLAEVPAGGQRRGLLRFRDLCDGCRTAVDVEFVISRESPR